MRTGVNGSLVPPPTGLPVLTPKARSVIWIFLSGGVSHLETFDPKPLLNRYAGKTYDATTLPNPQKSPLFLERSRSVVGRTERSCRKILPLQVGLSQSTARSGMRSQRLVAAPGDVRRRHRVRPLDVHDRQRPRRRVPVAHRPARLDEQQPTIGSWISYGLGTLNENLPQFVFLGQYQGPAREEGLRRRLPRPAARRRGAVARPGEPAAVRHAAARTCWRRSSRTNSSSSTDLNELAAVEYPDDEQLRGPHQDRTSWRSGCRCRFPKCWTSPKRRPRRNASTASTARRPSVYGRRLLAARRLAERGVRFTLVYLSDYGEWDSHQQLKKIHAQVMRSRRQAARRPD